MAMAVAAVVPLLGGTLGCYNRAESLGWDNASWILTWSAIPSIVCVIVCGLLGSLRSSKRISSEGYLGLTLLNFMVCFAASLWFVDQASGV